MSLSLAIAIVTGALVCVSVVFRPSVKIGKVEIGTYWVVSLVGAIVCLAVGCVPASYVLDGLVADTAVNPIKILVLFFSMTLLSVYLDELGVFEYLANKALVLGNGKQMRMFVALYAMVSVLTVFTSNDIIVLTFTPFICHFCARAKISPVPYLFCEFIAANTWSMCLVIGNPTNIYLATSAGVDFGQYFCAMILPTIAGGVTSFFMLWLLFAKRLSAPMCATVCQVEIKNKTEVIVGCAHLAVCLVLLAIGSYIGLEMWMVSLCLAVSLCLFTLVYSAVKKQGQGLLLHTCARLPFQLVPFVLSMFVLVLAMSYNGDVKLFADLLQNGDSVWTVGLSGLAVANVINNIPMAVLFSEMLSVENFASGNLVAVYSAVVASNLGAYLTPIGALAGIMWLGILKKQDVSVGFGTFIKYGAAVCLPTLVVTLAVLSLVV